MTAPAAVAELLGRSLEPERLSRNSGVELLVGRVQWQEPR